MFHFSIPFFAVFLAVPLLEPQAVLWEDGTIILLGFLPGTAVSKATAINDNNLIVGTSYGLGLSLAVLWENQIAYDLNMLIDQSGWLLKDATDINANGDIVGLGYNPLGERTSFHQ